MYMNFPFVRFFSSAPSTNVSPRASFLVYTISFQIFRGRLFLAQRLRMVYIVMTSRVHYVTVSLSISFVNKARRLFHFFFSTPISSRPHTTAHAWHILHSEYFGDSAIKFAIKNRKKSLEPRDTRWRTYTHNNVLEYVFTKKTKKCIHSKNRDFFHVGYQYSALDITTEKLLSRQFPYNFGVNVFGFVIFYINVYA